MNDPACPLSSSSARVSVTDTELETVLLDGDAVDRTLSRIAHEIIEGNPELDRVALVGIHTRGVPLAQRLRRRIADWGALTSLVSKVLRAR